MVDLRKLAISRGLDRGDRNIGVAGNKQRERGSIVGLRVAKRSDKESRVEGFRNRKELDGKVFLRLKRLLAAIQNTHGSTPSYQLESRFAIVLHIERI